MRKLAAVISLSLDGVMQAPGRPDEDRRGGFARGGWAQPYNDAVAGRVLGGHMARDGVLLFGRRTYQDFASFWPDQADNPYTDVLNRRRKYVASSTLAGPLPWQNSTLLRGEAAGAVAELKAEPGADIVILGSGALVRSLLPHRLIDEFLLLIHPLVLGTGRRLFPDEDPGLPLRLVESATTTTGVVIATYRPV